MGVPGCKVAVVPWARCRCVRDGWHVRMTAGTFSPARTTTLQPTRLFCRLMRNGKERVQAVRTCGMVRVLYVERE